MPRASRRQAPTRHDVAEEMINPMTRRRRTGEGWLALVLVGSLAGCVSAADRARQETSATRADAHARMPERLRNVNGAQAACEALRAERDRPWSAAADCYNLRFVGAFAAGDAPYKTALFVNIAERSAIAERVDRGATTTDQGRSELERVDKSLVEDVRKAIKPQELKTLQKEHAQDLAIQDELLQRQADTEALLQAFERIRPRP